MTPQKSTNVEKLTRIMASQILDAMMLVSSAYAVGYVTSEIVTEAAARAIVEWKHENGGYLDQPIDDGFASDFSFD